MTRCDSCPFFCRVNGAGSFCLRSAFATQAGAVPAWCPANAEEAAMPARPARSYRRGPVPTAEWVVLGIAGVAALASVLLHFLGG